MHTHAAQQQISFKEFETPYQRRGALPERDETMPEDAHSDSEEIFPELQAASVRSRIAVGERKGKWVRRLGSQEFFNGHPELTGSQCANHGGFSLHAGVYCFPGNRTQLEQVIRYVFRPAIAEGRLSLGPNDQIIYRLKRAYTDGTTHLLFSGVEFLEKIAALVPPHSKTRAQIVPKPETEKPDTQTTATTPEKSDDTKAKQRRIFQIDVTKCDACGGEMKIIAAILEKEVIHKILGHLDLPTQPPDLAPARLPSQMSFA